MAFIELKNIAKEYSDGTRALRGVSFDVDEGEFVGIMGPSGSGKSTLLHILGFLDTQSKGTYTFERKTFDDYGPEGIARLRNEKMGFVFQMFNLLSRASVLENVKLPLTYSSVPSSEWDKRALEAIESVGLAHRVEHEPSELSGGEKQRVAIARALVNNPEIIFADEPTGNLDSKSGKAVMEILQELNEKRGHTVFLITHETYTAEHAKRIITIRDGEIASDFEVKKRRWARDHFAK
ncbi:MAG: macrolide ABC transporter ATP-binding protein [Candidatus Niyogibacteria bacterium CG10_big_fil_rev_8_21_14_0_10_46_36]|uniref:Macrolide ABC transporter ATP-binding protein n=1 Tax=Candidatus Niyogibacteria bacterium CG10_big_fil_rev_8_21_14_0_10_46_36 TaxID=1974726 RepID=A0A2H0TCU7_9BACT|nr:MAG: macrolide ABC transporter ATP-binding protein [Candidatus Niyogibacteria bacterium CG10_big_fil_rev_8_21_14_0_10_46_36]